MRAAALATWALALIVTSAAASPRQFLSVGDPIYEELRTLDLFADSSIAGRIRLPHLNTLPLVLSEIQGGAPAKATGAAAISLARIERVLGRDARAGFEPDARWPSTPRLFARGPEEQRLEFSAGLEGRGDSDTDTSTVTSGSGLHLRAGLAVDRWFVYSHLVVGHFDQARSFADPVVANTDLTTLTEESYISYAGRDDAWGVQFGRDRWQWGPGEEGSLILSKTSAPLTGLAFRGRLAALRLDGIALNVTLDPATGEQLAAHRLEWQPQDRLRLGVTEAARYHATSWTPLYAVGVIPYVIVQRLLVQDSPDSADALRNNILFGGDFSWRVSDGTRLYGELAIDDLHAKTSANPDKLAWQLGWSGAGMIGAQRFTWNGEITRVWRYVYTSYFGRTYEAQGQPIGYPTGPDSRRLLLRVSWDPSVAWQLTARAAATDRGEGTLTDTFVPGSPHVDASQFLGVVEHTRQAEAGARWWPAGGVDISASAGYRRIDNAAHVTGAKKDGAYAHVELTLTR
jgi:Capsule assembly protein Wzi